MFRYALFFIILFPVHFYADAPSEIPKLIVRGSANLKKPADEVRLKIGVVSQNQKADIALKQNRDQMRSMINVLNSLGLTSKDYETEQFSMEPVYSSPPKNPPNDWRAAIIGYKVENKIDVKTSQFDLAAKIIDQASDAGANSVDILEFGVQDPQSHFAEVIDAAAKNAMAEAHTLAKAANLNLKRILEINLENVEGGKRRLTPHYYAPKMLAMANEQATPLEAGNVEFTASIHLVYEIEPLLK